MNKITTLTLLVVLSVLLIPAILIGVILLPSIINEATLDDSYNIVYIYWFVICGYFLILPYVCALVISAKLTILIRNFQYNSEVVGKLIQYIKYFALTFSVIILIMMPAVYHIADIDDAPGLILFVFSFSILSLGVALFADIFKKLVLNRTKV